MGGYFVLGLCIIEKIIITNPIKQTNGATIIRLALKMSGSNA